MDYQVELNVGEVIQKLNKTILESPKSFTVQEAVNSLLYSLKRAQTASEAHREKHGWSLYFVGSHIFDKQGNIRPNDFVRFFRVFINKEVNTNTINRARQKNERKGLKQHQ